MLYTLAVVVAVVVGIGVLASVAFVADTWIRFGPKVARIFEEKPLFLTEEGDPPPDTEEVYIRAADGLMLRGSYWRTLAPDRRGVVLFCHEFLSDRWSARGYCEPLRDAGFDIFTFDFRNHGQSESMPGYDPLQWVTDYEVTDVLAAIDYLQGRSDADPGGIGLFGISRGASAGLCAAAVRPVVRAIVTDGAFPTRGTQIYYMRCWAHIYSKLRFLHMRLPTAFWQLLAWLARNRVGRHRRCHFSHIEWAVSQLRSRPMFLIHGGRDTYIVPEIARELYRRAGRRTRLWIIPQAKHGKCLDAAGDQYRRRVVRFLTRVLADEEGADRLALAEARSS